FLYVNKNCFFVLYILCMLLMPMMLKGMYIPARTYQRARATTMRTQLPKDRVPAVSVPTIQRRTVARAEQMKHLHSKLTKEAQPASPVLGAARYESGILQKILSSKSDT